MLEQDFEKLLAAYFEDGLDDDGLKLLTESIEKTPANRRRYQRELRLHTLMREAASVMLEKGEKRPSKSPLTYAWRKIAAVAAVVALCGVLSQVLWNGAELPAVVGRCIDVSDRDDLTLVRQGESLSVSKETELRAGDRISTGNQAQASLDLDGVGIVTLQAQSEIEIFMPDDAAAVNVKKGLVLVEADKREEGQPPVLFRTPKAEVEVMGTVFGLEVDATATRVRVHEGLVRYAEPKSDRAVEVGAGKYCETGGKSLEVRDQSDLLPGALMPGQIRLQPVADLCLDGVRVFNNTYLKVENDRRVSYLKFEIPEGAEIVDAKLLLTQMVDPGSGTLRVQNGSNNDWSESSMTAKNAPKADGEMVERKGWIRLDQVVEINVSSLIKSAGTHTLMISLEGKGSNDVWFGSKESPHPPELILTREEG